MSSSIMPFSTISTSKPSKPRYMAMRFLPSTWTSSEATTAFPSFGLPMPMPSSMSFTAFATFMSAGMAILPLS